MTRQTIHLGYEVGTGAAISIPLAHLVVAGQTQQSGKTTTLEAIIQRSELRAIAFKTKPDESAFAGAHSIPPFFQHRADWQFVYDILGAELNEKLKFHRPWIMQVTRAAHTLKDVHDKVKKSLKEAKRGLDQSVYTELDAFLSIVVPELDKLPFTTSLNLKPGLNVMDLSRYSIGLQMLVISAVLDHVHKHERNLVVIIPEAWQFVPQKRGSPVMRSAEKVIREKAAGRVFVFLDSQDLSSINTDIRKHCSVWLIGVQKEENEVQRAIKHLSGLYDGRKLKTDDVRGLKLGQFFLVHSDQIKKVYVQPDWMVEGHAQQFAQGLITMDELSAIYSARSAGQHVEEEDDSVWKEKAEQLAQELEQLKEFMRRSGLNPDRCVFSDGAPRGTVNEGARTIPHSSESNGNSLLSEELYKAIRERILADPQAQLILSTARPEMNVRIQRQIVQLDESTLRGKCAMLLAAGFFDQPKKGQHAFDELTRRGAKPAKPNVYRELDKLAEMGFLYVLPNNQGYQAVPGMKVTTNTLEAA